MGRHVRLPFLAALLVAGAAYAGLKNMHLHQFPAPDFARQQKCVLLEGPYTASVANAFTFKALHDMWIERVSASARAMSGTITQFTIPLYDADNQIALRSLSTAIDMYDAALASAGREQVAVLPDAYRPLLLKANHQWSVSVLIDGSNSPSASDITFCMDYHAPVGQEAP